MASLRRCGSVLAILALSLVVIPEAAAFPPEGPSYGNACGDTIDYEYQDNGTDPWSSVSWQSYVTTGLNDWDGLKDVWGNEYVNANTTTGTDIAVRLDDTIGATTSANATCGSNRRIRFNPDRINDAANTNRWARDVAAHEMGHLWGLSHTGDRHDSMDTSGSTTGARPAMSTCRFNVNNTIKNDDRAALSFRFDPTDNMLISDRSAENLSSSSWKAVGGLVRTFTSVSFAGSWSIKATPSGIGSLEQWVNYSSPPSSEALSSGVIYRNSSSSNSGNLFGYTYQREVRYDSSTCNSRYKTNRDQRRDRTYEGAWVLSASASTSVSCSCTTWYWFPIGSFNVLSSVGSAEATDIRLQLVPGTSGAVHFDAAQIRK